VHISGSKDQQHAPSPVACQNLSVTDSHSIRVVRVYELDVEDRGSQWLVDRRWPRGVKRDSLQLAGWAREAAPSDELRRWFGHEPSRWQEFWRRYVEELDANPAAWRPFLDAARDGNLLLLYAARDRDRNNAVVLRDYLLMKLSRNAADEGDTDSSG
jgi:uncharacterized protein YeaO (DUF488 family)